MIAVAFAPQFRRQFKKLLPALQEEILVKISLFENVKNHPTLHVHKLGGKMLGRWSFSVNYRFRIVFMWEVQSKSAILLAVGDHAIYE